MVCSNVKIDYTWTLKTRRLTFGRARPLVLGVLNVTPDSFSDGGKFFDRDRAVEHALAMLNDGADIVDIGGESTRPGAEPVGAEMEIERVVPVIEALRRRTDAIVSVDTSKSAVARAALAAGAEIVNDVTGLEGDPALMDLCAATGCGVIVMHMRGTPKTMQACPAYDDAVARVRDYLAARIERALAAGIARDKIVIDPGIGFGKTVRHNLELIDGIDALTELGYPVLLGVSRKSFIGKITGIADPAAREIPTQAVHAAAFGRGVFIFRAHDVRATRLALTTVSAIACRASIKC